MFTILKFSFVLCCIVVVPVQAHSQHLTEAPVQFHNAFQHSNCLPELSAPNLSSAGVQGVIPTPSYSPDGCFVPTTQFRTETRTRTVPVTRFVFENVPEHILCPDGRCITRIRKIRRQVIEHQTQSYTVQVPYSSTVQVVRSEIPAETARDQKLDAIIDKLDLILGEERDSNDQIKNPVEPTSLKKLKELIEDLGLSEKDLKPFAAPDHGLANVESTRRLLKWFFCRITFYDCSKSMAKTAMWSWTSYPKQILFI